MPADFSEGARRQLDRLVETHPEWTSWLSLVAETLHSTADPVWTQVELSLAMERPPSAPLLADAVLGLPAGLADAWVRDLLEQASHSDDPGMVPFGLAANAETLDAEALVEAAIRQDAIILNDIATHFDIDPDAFVPIAQLATVPLLQACRRRLADQVPDEWTHGYCPICRCSATIAESRGLERARRLRCGRCGGDWGMVAFKCPFCGNADHATLGSLLSETEGETRKVDTCAICRGYVKSVTTLRAWQPDEVMLADLATVDLDLVALDRGYTRPETLVWSIHLRSLAPVPGGEDGTRR